MARHIRTNCCDNPLALVYHHSRLRFLLVVTSPTPVHRYPRALLGTCPIPWRSDTVWDEPLFRRVVRDLATELSPHLYLFGTAGEGHAVTERQFQELTTAFVDELRQAGGVPMVGVIHTSLPTVIERLAWAGAHGVREFQISLPSWAALNDGELDTFFAETCGRFPEYRFLHYNTPRSGRLLTAGDYARLSSRHPNLVAIKMGGTDLAALQAIANAAPELRLFCTEFAYIALRHTLHCGLLCALSACAPALAQRLHAADSAEARALEPVYRALHTAAREAVAGRAHVDGAYDKLYLKLHYPEFPLRLLPPYASAGNDRFARFAGRAQEILAFLST